MQCHWLAAEDRKAWNACQSSTANLKEQHWLPCVLWNKMVDGRKKGENNRFKKQVENWVNYCVVCAEAAYPVFFCKGYLLDISRNSWMNSMLRGPKVISFVELCFHTYIRTCLCQDGMIAQGNRKQTQADKDLKIGLMLTDFSIHVETKEAPFRPVMITWKYEYSQICVWKMYRSTVENC